MKKKEPIIAYKTKNGCVYYFAQSELDLIRKIVSSPQAPAELKGLIKPQQP
jgi:uncharacterized protein (UPF0216 family)